MATWAEFAAAEPEVAAVAFPKPPDMFFALAYLGTATRRRAPCPSLLPDLRRGAAVRCDPALLLKESVRHDPIFEFDIERVDAAHWENVGQPGTYAVRRRWPDPG